MLDTLDLTKEVFCCLLITTKFGMSHVALGGGNRSPDSGEDWIVPTGYSGSKIVESDFVERFAGTVAVALVVDGDRCGHG